mmetsp:Transcript_44298/g.72075  ORF Transcript_44298/g.72075 Transcript_44298/m.72075 type:complete len:387 (+) Transcript_44298:536-1696(+)
MVHDARGPEVGGEAEAELDRGAAVPVQRPGRQRREHVLVVGHAEVREAPTPRLRVEPGRELPIAHARRPEGNQDQAPADVGEPPQGVVREEGGDRAAERVPRDDDRLRGALGDNLPQHLLRLEPQVRALRVHSHEPLVDAAGEALELARLRLHVGHALADGAGAAQADHKGLRVLDRNAQQHRVRRRCGPLLRDAEVEDVRVGKQAADKGEPVRRGVALVEEEVVGHAARDVEDRERGLPAELELRVCAAREGGPLHWRHGRHQPFVGVAEELAAGLLHPCSVLLAQRSLRRRHLRHRLAARGPLQLRLPVQGILDAQMPAAPGVQRQKHTVGVCLAVVHARQTAHLQIPGHKLVLRQQPCAIAVVPLPFGSDDLLWDAVVQQRLQ